ncbi:RluA family pseudouridine synthase [Mycoplasma sp. T363T]|uniref:RluA family pseudouridine synthase n=1 Tax=Mycoplasma bradburyae TaxID=2963128 RepID=UPI0023424E40|nr:RluA family pseudouridine synthase [Mycoplasma bradburyae]MDC4163526.1 RluA family pseudouridine synthase [Mycoplasma bradburyae]
MIKHRFLNENTSKIRLDVFLTYHLNLSRNKTSYLIVNDLVKVNKKPVNKNNFILKEGDVIELEYDEAIFNKSKDEILPFKKKLDIVFEDDDLLIVNKPTNMLSHPTTHNEPDTLLNCLMHHNKKQKVYLAHRLDKDTTGLIVATKNFEALQKIQEQIVKRTMKRYYLAIVHYPFNELRATINAPIGYLKDHDLKFGVENTKNPKDAITKIYVINQNKKYALIKCELLTGRTHQIRVHMDFIKHNIVNDPLYGVKGEQRTDYKQFLHAYQLELTHPSSGVPLFFEVAPDEVFMKKLFDVHLDLNQDLKDLFK